MQPLLQWKSNKYYIFCVCVCMYYIFCVCVCSLRYPECNVCVPHCHLWLVQLYNIFSHCLINGMIFEKNKTRVFISSKIFV